MWQCVSFSVCMDVCFLCAYACLGESHLQSTGSLIDWIKPPDRAQTEWKLNKITVIYSCGNGNLSGDPGAADLCPATKIWAENASHSAHSLPPPGNSWCITAATDQSIYLLPALPSLHLLPARTPIPQRSCSVGESVLPVHACPPPSPVRGITAGKEASLSLLSLLYIHSPSESNRATDCRSPAWRQSRQFKAEELKMGGGGREEVGIRECGAATLVLINGPLSACEWRIIRRPDGSFITVRRAPASVASPVHQPAPATTSPLSLPPGAARFCRRRRDGGGKEAWGSTAETLSGDGAQVTFLAVITGMDATLILRFTVCLRR